MNGRRQWITSVWLATFCLGVGRPAFASGCGPGLETTAVDQGWSTLTDPRAYSPGQPFRFVVHALTDDVLRLLQQIETLRIALDQGRSPQPVVDLALAPERIAEKQFVSTSLISDQRLATWSNAGLILKPKASHVVAMSDGDMGALHGLGIHYEGAQLAEYEQSLAARHPVVSPTDLLRISDPGTYNEVLLRGRDAGGTALELQGFFIINDETGRSSVAPELLRNLTWAASRLHLPLVHLTRSRPAYEDEPVAIAKPRLGSPGFISWQSQGVRHIVWVTEGREGQGTFVGEYAAYKFFGAETATSLENRNKFAAALVAEIPRNPGLAATLKAAGLQVTSSGWTNPGGQPFVQPPPPPSPSVVDADFSFSMPSFSMPSFIDLRESSYADEKVRAALKVYNAADIDFVSWQKDGIRHVLKAEPGGEYTAYGPGHKTVTSAKLRILFERELKDACAKDARLRDQLIKQGVRLD